MAKKNSVPARHHQYVKRQKKFIEMPKEQLIKICAIIAAAILVIVLIFVLVRALDGHLAVTDGKVVAGGDNWIIANTRTSADPRYFKLAEVGEVEGYARALDTTEGLDSNLPIYVYTPTDEASPITSASVAAGADTYEKIIANVQSFYASYYPNAVLGQVGTEDVAGRHARSLVYTQSIDNPVVEAESTPVPDATPAPEATAAPETTEPPEAVPVDKTYTRGMYVILEAGHARSIVLSVTAQASSEEALPSEAVLKEAADRVAAQIKID